MLHVSSPCQCYTQTCSTSKCGCSDSHSYLWSLVEKSIPYLEEDVTDDTVNKHHQEPVEGDQGEVHFMLLKVSMKSRQLLIHQVLKHTLVHLQTKKYTALIYMYFIINLTYWLYYSVQISTN